MRRVLDRAVPHSCRPNFHSQLNKQVFVTQRTAFQRRPRRHGHNVVQCSSGKLQVVFVSPEVVPWSKSGGLADVLSGLPAALAERGHRVMTVSPRYAEYIDTVDSGVRAPVCLGRADGAGTIPFNSPRELQGMLGLDSAAPTQLLAHPPVRFFLSDQGDGVQHVLIDHPVFKSQQDATGPAGCDSVYQHGGVLPAGQQAGLTQDVPYCAGPACDSEQLQLRNSVLCQAALAAPLLLWQGSAQLSVEDRRQLAQLQEQLQLLAPSSSSGEGQAWNMARGVARPASVAPGSAGAAGVTPALQQQLRELRELHQQDLASTYTATVVQPGDAVSSQTPTDTFPTSSATQHSDQMPASGYTAHHGDTAATSGQHSELAADGAAVAGSGAAGSSTASNYSDTVIFVGNDWPSGLLALWLQAGKDLLNSPQGTQTLLDRARQAQRGRPAAADLALAVELLEAQVVEYEQPASSSSSSAAAAVAAAAGGSGDGEVAFTDAQLDLTWRAVVLGGGGSGPAAAGAAAHTQGSSRGGVSGAANDGAAPPAEGAAAPRRRVVAAARSAAMLERVSPAAPRVPLARQRSTSVAGDSAPRSSQLTQALYSATAESASPVPPPLTPTQQPRARASTSPTDTRTPDTLPATTSEHTDGHSGDTPTLPHGPAFLDLDVSEVQAGFSAAEHEISTGSRVLIWRSSPVLQVPSDGWLGESEARPPPVPDDGLPGPSSAFVAQPHSHDAMQSLSTDGDTDTESDAADTTHGAEVQTMGHADCDLHAAAATASQDSMGAEADADTMHGDGMGAGGDGMDGVSGSRKRRLRRQRDSAAGLAGEGESGDTAGDTDTHWASQWRVQQALTARKRQATAARNASRRLVAFQRLVGKRMQNSKFALTLHNLAYQGLFQPHSYNKLGLPPAAASRILTGTRDPSRAAAAAGPLPAGDAAAAAAAGLPDGPGLVNWLQAAVVSSDVVVTVSPQYAEEVMTQAEAAVAEQLRAVQQAAASKEQDLLAAQLEVQRAEAELRQLAQQSLETLDSARQVAELAELQLRLRLANLAQPDLLAAIAAPQPETDLTTAFANPTAPAGTDINTLESVLLPNDSASSRLDTTTTYDNTSDNTNAHTDNNNQDSAHGGSRAMSISGAGTAAPHAARPPAPASTGAEIGPHTRHVFRALWRQGVVGIMNGVDTRKWDPETDRFLPRRLRYTVGDVHAKKARIKALLQARLGLNRDPTAPLVAFIGRLEDQKGADTLISVLPSLLGPAAATFINPRTGTLADADAAARVGGNNILVKPSDALPSATPAVSGGGGVFRRRQQRKRGGGGSGKRVAGGGGRAAAGTRPQVVMVGAGDAWLQQCLAQLTLAWPGQAHGHVGFSEPLAHLLMAAADYIVVPSRYEPCGLVALSALRYGTLPIVSPVGGLPAVAGVSSDTQTHTPTASVAITPSAETDSAGSTGANACDVSKARTMEQSAGASQTAESTVPGSDASAPTQDGVSTQPAEKVDDAPTSKSAITSSNREGTRGTVDTDSGDAMLPRGQSDDTLLLASEGYVIGSRIGPATDPAAFRAGALALEAALRAALAEYGAAAFRARRERAMGRDVSWDAPAAAWEAVLSTLVEPTSEHAPPPTNSHQDYETDATDQASTHDSQ